MIEITDSTCLSKHELRASNSHRYDEKNNPYESPLSGSVCVCVRGREREVTVDRFSCDNNETVEKV